MWAAAAGTLSYPTADDLNSEQITIGGDPDDFDVLEISVNDSLKLFYLHLATHPRSLSVHLQGNLDNQNLSAIPDPNSQPMLPAVFRTGPTGPFSLRGSLQGLQINKPVNARVLLSGIISNTNVSVRCVTAVVLPKPDGSYEFSGLASGYYHIRPLATGYSFMNNDPAIRQPGPVNAGDLVGASGNAGGISGCFGPHLHFEVQRKTGVTVYDYPGTSTKPRPLSYIPVDPYGWHSDQDDPYFLIPDLQGSGLSNETLWPQPQ